MIELSGPALAGVVVWAGLYVLTLRAMQRTRPAGNAAEHVARQVVALFWPVMLVVAMFIAGRKRRGSPE